MSEEFSGCLCHVCDILVLLVAHFKSKNHLRSHETWCTPVAQCVEN